MLEVLKFIFVEANKFFKILYHEGIWLRQGAAKDAVGHGYSIADALALYTVKQPRNIRNKYT